MMKRNGENVTNVLSIKLKAARAGGKGGMARKGITA